MTNQTRGCTQTRAARYSAALELCRSSLSSGSMAGFRGGIMTTTTTLQVLAA